MEEGTKDSLEKTEAREQSSPPNVQKDLEKVTGSKRQVVITVVLLIVFGVILGISLGEAGDKATESEGSTLELNEL